NSRKASRKPPGGTASSTRWGKSCSLTWARSSRRRVDPLPRSALRGTGVSGAGIPPHIHARALKQLHNFESDMYDPADAPIRYRGKVGWRWRATAMGVGRQKIA